MQSFTSVSEPKWRGVGPATAPHLLPTFLIIGAAKSGTTSVWAYLDQHPDIYMSPKKETDYFIADEGVVVEEVGPRGRIVHRNRVSSLAAYSALFQGAKAERARGEASPYYLCYPGVTGRIRRTVPDAKIIVMLRDPVDRAHSNFLHHQRDGLEVLDFAAALRAEPERIAAGWAPKYHYRSMGLYYEKLRPFYDAFGAGAVHVFLYDDLKNDPVGLMRSLFGTLGVDETFVPDVGTQHNISGVPKNRRLHQVYSFLRGANRSALKEFGKRLLPASERQKLKATAFKRLGKNLEKPRLEADLRADLLAGYREDILKVQGLVGRDLSHWL